MGLTPKEMKIAMDAGKVLVDECKNKAYLDDGIYVFEGAVVKKKVLMQSAWSDEDWQIYEEQNPVFPFKCFDRVLVKNGKGPMWRPRFFEQLFRNDEYPFLTINDNSYKFIAPYEGNEDFANNPDGVKGIWTREML